jgi:sec-independent protein translocase protein TatA
MHAMGPLQLIVIAAVVLILFGRGKVSSLMGEVGKGISAFKKGVSDGQAEADKPADAAPVATVKDVTPIDKDQA